MTSKIKTRAVVASAALLLLAGTGAAATANATPRPTSLTSSTSVNSFVSATSAAVTSVGTGAGVAAKPKPRSYKNCTALHKVYPHGVGRKGAKDKVRGGGKPVTSWTVDTKTYNLNKKSDRDKDGVACEKK